MSGQVSHRKPTSSDFRHLEKHLQVGVALHEKKEELTNIYNKTKNERDVAEVGKQECLAKMKECQVDIETSQKIQAHAKEKLAKVEVNNVYIQETTAQILKNNAASILDIKNSLIKMHAGLKQTPGSTSLIETTKNLMNELKLLDQQNKEGKPVSNEIVALRLKLQELTTSVKELLKTNSGKK